MDKRKDLYKRKSNKDMKKARFSDKMTGKYQEKVLHEYHKMLKKEQTKLKQSSAVTHKIYLEEESREKSTSLASHDTTRKKSRRSALHRAKLDWSKKQQDKLKQKQEQEQRQKEKEEALARYEKRKKCQYKKLCVKNYKGQPNMASQMEILLNRLHTEKMT